jgi:hypothetical protein
MILPQVKPLPACALFAAALNRMATAVAVDVLPVNRCAPRVVGEVVPGPDFAPGRRQFLENFWRAPCFPRQSCPTILQIARKMQHWPGRAFLRSATQQATHTGRTGANLSGTGIEIVQNRCGRPCILGTWRYHAPAISRSVPVLSALQLAPAGAKGSAARVMTSGSIGGIRSDERD